MLAAVEGPRDRLHRRNLEGGGGKIGRGYLNLKKSQVTKRGGDWFEPALHTHTPLSPFLTIFLFAPLQLSSQKKTIIR